MAFKLKSSNTVLEVGELDSGGEIELALKDTDGNTLGIIWIDQYCLPTLILHLKSQVKPTG